MDRSEAARHKSRRMARVLTLLMIAGLLFAGVTLAALEGQEVVVLHTADPSGRGQATRTWIAVDDDGSLLVEAANPERPFLHDLQTGSTLELERAGTRRTCTATTLPNPAGHERIRRLLAARYGWADCWIGLIADTRTSLAVRLACP